MSKPISYYIAYLVLLAFACGLSNVNCDEQEVITKDAFSFTIPNLIGETPLLETNDQNGRYFGVHIPMIYDGILHFRDTGIMSTKIHSDFVNGLAAFTYDKTPQADGNLHGLVNFKLLWITLYDSNQ